MNASNVTQKPRLHQDWIDPHAIGIVRALQRADYTTYLVGGCVRDLLLGIHPKDFDIATTALPNEVRRIIHRAYVIGKRFRLVLVRRDEAQFEVATFRRELREDEVEVDAPVQDNAYGSPEEDARRRDFTINGLFYDPIGDQLIDYADGIPDLESRWIRMIGDPAKRLVEDPIRILRALRLKHMIGFAFDRDLRQAMHDQAASLTTTVLPRRREEILKLLRLKNPDLAFREAYDLGILQYLSPTLLKIVESDHGDTFFNLLAQIPQPLGEPEMPADLFGWLVHAYVRASLQPEPSSGPESRKILTDETFQKWMRDELGMFKYEQAQAVKAFHVETLLERRKDFQRRGERRQRALLVNESFPLALKFATRDYGLPAEDLMYWRERRLSLSQEPAGPRRPRRRRRRPRKPSPTGKET